MLALDIMLVALAQAAVSAPAPNAAPARVPNVEVVGPRTRVICRTIIPSGSHISARRVCQTQAQRDEQVDRAQTEADLAMRSTYRRTEEMLISSGYMKGTPRPH